MSARPRTTRGRFARLSTLGVFVTVIFVAAFTVGCSSSSGTRPTQPAARPAAHPLAIESLPTPRLRVPHYDTSGVYPQVRRPGRDLRAVNAALREAVLEDERAYGMRARAAARTASKICRGVYSTLVVPQLSSASTVVTSVLMPATKLYPCGNEGRTWLAVTVRVPSGATVHINDLFSEPEVGLHVLSKEWKNQVRRTKPRMWPCVEVIPTEYRPTPSNYRNFALTPNGLAVGFWQAPACDRLYATVPYATLHPYLSKLGRLLIKGVRGPE